MFWLVFFVFIILLCVICDRDRLVIRGVFFGLGVVKVIGLVLNIGFLVLKGVIVVGVLVIMIVIRFF